MERLPPAWWEITKDRVTFVSVRACLRSFQGAKTLKPLELRRVRKRFGREPDKVTGVFGIYKVRLPSGTETKAPKTDQLAITHDGAGQATVQQSASETDRAVRRLEMALN